MQSLLEPKAKRLPGMDGIFIMLHIEDFAQFFHVASLQAKLEQVKAERDAANSTKEAEKKILLQEIEANVVTKAERDMLREQLKESHESLRAVIRTGSTIGQERDAAEAQLAEARKALGTVLVPAAQNLLGAMEELWLVVPEEHEDTSNVKEARAATTVLQTAIDTLAALSSHEPTLQRGERCKVCGAGIGEDRKCLSCETLSHEPTCPKLLKIGDCDCGAAQPSESVGTRETMLMQALADVLAKIGVVRPGIALDGPQLLTAAGTFMRAGAQGDGERKEKA